MELQLEQRLTELRAEYESGQKILKEIELKLVELEDRKKSLSETLLRISGAIDLLEEVLGKEVTEGPETRSGLGTINENVEVPNVLRQPLEKAIKTLKEAGLTAGEIVEQKGVLPIGVMVGEILRQEPKPGTKSPVGSAVKLVVAAKGKFLPPDRNSCISFSERT
jgi:CRISPR/Cas system-associated exonuclease Cas4 (RecB family)